MLSGRGTARKRGRRRPPAAAAPVRPLGTDGDPVGVRRSPGSRAPAPDPAAAGAAGTATAACAGGTSPGKSTRAHTTLRPSSPAVQPWAPDIRATRYRPSPPRAASRSTAGTGGKSPAASLTSTSQLEPAAVTTTCTGPPPCRSPLLTSSSKASSSRSRSSSAAPGGRLPFSRSARSCIRSARSSASVVGVPRRTARPGEPSCGRGRFPHSASLMSLISGDGAGRRRRGTWTVRDWVPATPRRSRADRRRISYGSGTERYPLEPGLADAATGASFNDLRQSGSASVSALRAPPPAPEYEALGAVEEQAHHGPPEGRQHEDLPGRQVTKQLPGDGCEGHEPQGPQHRAAGVIDGRAQAVVVGDEREAGDQDGRERQEGPRRPAPRELRDQRGYQRGTGSGPEPDEGLLLGHLPDRTGLEADAVVVLLDFGGHQATTGYSAAATTTQATPETAAPLPAPSRRNAKTATAA